MNRATRILVSTFGAYVGLAGIEHGIGEILQGSVPPTGNLILSWPDAPFFKALSGEPAFTIIPNLLITGLLACFFSLAYIAWAVLLVKRKGSGVMMLLISVPMFLFGAGIFPPVLGILIGAAATRIYSPLTWWRSHLSPAAQSLLSAIWPWAFGACLFSWLLMFPGMAALSYFFGVQIDSLIFGLLFCMFGFLILAGVAGYARDLQNRIHAPPAALDMKAGSSS